MGETHNQTVTPTSRQQHTQTNKKQKQDKKNSNVCNFITLTMSHVFNNLTPFYVRCSVIVTTSLRCLRRDNWMHFTIGHDSVLLH